MSKSTYASLHAGMMMRGSTRIDAAPMQVRDMRQVSSQLPVRRKHPAGDGKRPLFAPLARRRAELLPPGWISLDDGRPSDATVEHQSAPEKAAAIAARADERISAARGLFGRRQTPPRSGPGRPSKGPRKAVTVRLDVETHRQLKLAAGNLRRTCQDLMATAIERHLAALDSGPGPKGLEQEEA